MIDFEFSSMSYFIRSTAVSKSDSSDVHTRVGFLHLIDHKNSLKVALISSGNDGNLLKAYFEKLSHNHRYRNVNY